MLYEVITDVHQIIAVETEDRLMAIVVHFGIHDHPRTLVNDARRIGSRGCKAETLLHHIAIEHHRLLAKSRAGRLQNARIGAIFV